MFETSIRNKSKKRNKIIFLFPIIFIPIVIFSLYKYIDVNIDTIQIDHETQQVPANNDFVKEQSRYFVAQVSLKDERNAISFQDLLKSKIATSEKYLEKLEKMDFEDVISIKGEVYDWYGDNGSQRIIITPLELVDPRLKTLRIDGIDIWEKDIDIIDYPLVISADWSEDSNFELIDENGESNYSSNLLFNYVVGGEVIPARAVARKFRRTNDYTFPFRNVEDLFVESDVSSIILENSISGYPEPCHGCTWFVGDEAFIEGLEFIDVDIITPGNHFGDGGISAIKRTTEVLDAAGISHSGFSSNSLEEAYVPAVISNDKLSLGVVGFDDVAYYHWVSESAGGVATVSIRDSNGIKTIWDERIKSSMKDAKEKSDFVVVLMSWGDREYVNWALDYQRDLAHKFIDSGADLIIGSHQHWVSEVEFYNGGMIFYGIGNFVFDQTHTDPTRQGVILDFTFFNKKLVNVKIRPHQSCGPQQNIVDCEECNHFQPVLLEESDPVYNEILSRMFEFSAI